MNNIKLRKIISNEDIIFLYDLLRERDYRINISHKEMPTYERHVEFVKSKPYYAWYIIKSDIKIGSIYITKNDEIGIFIKKEFQGLGKGSMALKKLMEKHPRKSYYANINPSNNKSIKFFRKNGFKAHQITYVKKNVRK